MVGGWVQPPLSVIFLKALSDIYTIQSRSHEMYTIYDIFQEPRNAHKFDIQRLASKNSLFCACIFVQVSFLAPQKFQVPAGK